MTTDVKLLPLPEPKVQHDALGGLYLPLEVSDYARANMEPLIAENERLAEALRKVGELLCEVECASAADALAVERCHDLIRAALDQEGGNG